MERVAKVFFVIVLVVSALLAGAEGGRDAPKTKDEVYSPQSFFGLGWPFLGLGWPFGGLWPFLGHPKAVGLKDEAVETMSSHGGAAGSAFP